jgi:hypothetical protein
MMPAGKSVHIFVLMASIICTAPLPAHADPLPSWSDQMETLKDIGDRLMKAADRGGTEESRQEMYSYILGTISNGYLGYVNMDPSHPTWVPLWNYAYNYGGANPDYVYMTTMVDPKGIYRISGYRGTSRFVEITQQAGNFTTVRAANAKGAMASDDLDSLKRGPNGYFSVILSAQRPIGYVGDWWKLDESSEALLMRKASYDWRNEIDPRIAINRLDDSPPMTAQQRAKKFSNLKNWSTTRIEAEINLARYYRENHGINTIKKSRLMEAAAPVAAQVYLDGAYQIKDDEALILETTIPAQCRYWQILVTDNRFTTVNWLNHQSSLNGFQAKLDKDGRFRAVIAARDPGVPNWLDTAGNTWGIMQMRWNHCSEAPEPTVKKVALNDVRKFLPVDTPVVGVDQRKTDLELRREAGQLRQLW